MKKNSIFKLASIALVLSSVGVTATAEVINSQSTMTIRNAFDMTEVSVLTFGTITAVQSVPTFYDSGTGSTTYDNTDAAIGGLDLDFSDTQTTGGVRVASDGTPNETIASDISAAGYFQTDGTSAFTQGGTENNVVTNGDEVFASSVREIIAGVPGEIAIANAASFTTLTVTAPAAPIPMLRSGSPNSESFILNIGLGDMTIKGGGRDATTVSATNMPQTDGTGAVGLVIGGTLLINPLFATGAMQDGVYSGNYEITVSY